MIIAWVNNFQTPKIQAVLSSFYCKGNDIARARGSNRGGGWAQYMSIKWSMKMSNWSYWTFLALTAFQINLKTKDLSQPYVAYPAF